MKWLDWIIDWWRAEETFANLKTPEWYKDTLQLSADDYVVMYTGRPPKTPLPDYVTVTDCGSWT